MPVALLFLLAAVPILGGLALALQQGLQLSAWAALRDDPQTLPALLAAVWTGGISTLLAAMWAGCLLAVAFGNPAWTRLMRPLGAMLAVPHVAFAIGFLTLIAPAGWFARLLSPWATGWMDPPAWATSQDPWGFGLILVLALKEVPFLLWAAAAHLQQPQVSKRLLLELQWAQTVGYHRSTAWWRVVWPQLFPSLRLPLLAVFVYGLTVVDVSLVIGPAAPPTLAVLAWQWLQDADPATSAKGTAAACALTLMAALSAWVVWAASRWPYWRQWRSSGYRPAEPSGTGRSVLPALLFAPYVLVLMALLAGSLMGYWPFPQLLPATWTPTAWAAVWDSSSTLANTLGLACASAATAWLWSVVWLEFSPPAWRKRAQIVLLLPLLLPALLWVPGLHQWWLMLRLESLLPGLWISHSLACLPYVLLTLQGPYSGADPRIMQVAASLGHHRWQVLWQIKWPLLRAPLLASLAVGFAVSVAQYLPTLYIGAGRFPTVTTEAVAMASGGQRALMAAYAWLLWLLPALTFYLAWLVGKPLRFSAVSRHNQGSLPDDRSSHIVLLFHA